VVRKRCLKLKTPRWGQKLVKILPRKCPRLELRTKDINQCSLCAMCSFMPAACCQQTTQPAIPLDSGWAFDLHDDNF
jgi:hypothetical protein